MAAMIGAGIMKQWTQDGVVMCSYRSVKVGKVEGTQQDTSIKKVWSSYIEYVL